MVVWGADLGEAGPRSREGAQNVGWAICDRSRLRNGCSAPPDPGLPLVSPLLTVARFLTCFLMWEILRAFTDRSLSSGIVIPDASMVMWGRSAQPASRIAALQSRRAGVSAQ